MWQTQSTSLENTENFLKNQDLDKDIHFLHFISHRKEEGERLQMFTNDMILYGDKHIIKSLLELINKCSMHNQNIMATTVFKSQ